MRIPKWQTMVGTSPGFQYRVQQRAQPGMRQPVRKETYLRDPRSGQRNMQLEVAAAGRGKYLASAISKGGQEIGTTLAMAEAESQLISQSSSFQLEISNGLNLVQGQKIAKEEIGGKDFWFNGQAETGLLPAYKTSLTTFTTWINDRRDYHANHISNAVARKAFLKGIAGDVSSAITQAASINRKQQIRWLQGDYLRTLENVHTLDGLQEMYQSPLGNLIFTGPQLKNYIEGRKNKLAMDHYSLWLLEANDDYKGTISKLQNFRNGLVDGKDYRAKSEGLYGDDPYWKLITAAQRLELDNKAARMIKAKEDADDLRLEKNYSDAIVGIYKNPYAPEYNRDALHIMVKEGNLDADKLPSLLTARKNAIALKGVTVQSNPKLSTEILSDISNPEYTVEFIIEHPQLSQPNKNSLIAARKEYERTSVDWMSADNPDGHYGSKAVYWLGKAFNHVPGMFPIGPPGRKTAENEDNFSRALFALQVKVVAWREEGIPNKKILRLAYEDALATYKEQKIDTRITALGDGTTGPVAHVQFEGTSEQYEAWEVYSKSHRRLNDGQPLTYQKLLTLPPGATRDTIAKKFQEYGWTFESGFVGEETDTDRLIKEADERGDGIEAGFIKRFPWAFGSGSFAEGALDVWF